MGNDHESPHLPQNTTLPEEADFTSLVADVTKRILGSTRSSQCVHLPSRAAVLRCIDQLRNIIFPGYFDDLPLAGDTLHFYVGRNLDLVRAQLTEQVRRGFCFARPDELSAHDCYDMARDRVARFLGELPRIRDVVMTDVQAAFDGDPAATSPDETIYCYPGVRAVLNHRFAHELYRLGVPLLPRIISEHAHSRTGIDIHPGAQIGTHFFIDHGTGVVIGETAVIGNNVRLYQGVTLGARSFPKDERGLPVKGIPRHPILQDNVIVYSGATILGRVIIGEGSVIGGNVWLTESVPPRSRVLQQTSVSGEVAKAAWDMFQAGEGI